MPRRNVLVDAILHGENGFDVGKGMELQDPRELEKGKKFFLHVSIRITESL
jgi:hypothetical protein